MVTVVQWLARLAVDQKAMGSNPISHPTNPIRVSDEVFFHHIANYGLPASFERLKVTFLLLLLCNT